LFWSSVILDYAEINQGGSMPESEPHPLALTHIRLCYGLSCALKFIKASFHSVLIFGERVFGRK
jgi:hypothetical protein